jgi:molybdopterin synthase catalytic subunit
MTVILSEIVTGPIVPFCADDSRTGEGAELVFNGRVRDTEHGKKILALEYEQYEGMADQELQRLAEETAAKFPISDLFVRHRVGRVEVGESSLHVAVWSKHRKEGIAAMSWFIVELKKRVPIWKWALLEDGSRVPSVCDHEHD